MDRARVEVEGDGNPCGPLLQHRNSEIAETGKGNKKDVRTRGSRNRKARALFSSSSAILPGRALTIHGLSSASNFRESRGAPPTVERRHVPLSRFCQDQVVQRISEFSDLPQRHRERQVRDFTPIMLDCFQPTKERERTWSPQTVSTA